MKTNGNKEEQKKQARIARKYALVFLPLLLVFVLIGRYFLPFIAWLFNNWVVSWVILGVVGISSCIGCFVSIMKGRITLFLLLDYLALASIICEHIIVDRLFEEGLPKRWANCLVTDWEGIYSKFGVKKVDVDGNGETIGKVYRFERVLKMYNADWEKCFVKLRINCEETHYKQPSDYDEKKERTYYAKVYNGNGDFIGEWNEYSYTYYKRTEDYCKKHNLLKRYEYYGTSYENDDQIILEAEAKYFGKEGYSLSDEYGYTGQGRRLVSESETKAFTVSVSANPNNGGGVTGGGTYDKGKSCTVTASANSDYSFSNWTENGKEVSSNASYTFTVSGNRSLVANFNAKSSPQPPQPIRQPQPMQVWVKCFACDGSGQCHTCLGLGHSLYGTDRCWNCGGSGRCTQCAGQGGHYEVQYY